MKNILLAVFAALAATGVGAQEPFTGQQPSDKKLATTVFIMGHSPRADEIKKEASAYFRRTFSDGFQQVQAPRFLLTDPKAKAMFSIGGFVNFRVGYDLANVIPSLDFVTYEIPMETTPFNRQRLLMDASTSRLFFKSVVRTAHGPLEAYIEADFRGGNYNLRLREAYLSFFGFTLGKTVTTFSDQAATFNTIDFEGPNGYIYERNLMFRYKYESKGGFSMAIAAEFPVVNATYNSPLSEPIYQRVPDIPLYVQYAWDGGRSHIRASGLLRNMYYRDVSLGKTVDELGWGAQLSGRFMLGRAVGLYGQVVYGKGLGSYIQDLQGTGSDLAPLKDMPYELISVEQMGWLAGIQINLTKRMPLTLGYSQVTVFDTQGLFKPTDYRIGQYAVGNLFYNFSSMWSVGVEYLYGRRTNFDGVLGESHRVQMAVQMNF